MFPKAKQLSVSAKNFKNVFATLGERDAEIILFNVRSMSGNTVDCADISGVLFTRKQLFAVRGKEFKVVHAVAVLVRFFVDNPFSNDAFVVLGAPLRSLRENTSR